MEDVLRNTGPFPNRQLLDIIYYYRSELRKDLFEGNLGLAMMQGEDWFKLRTVVNPILMQPKAILQYTTKMDTIAKDLVKVMEFRKKKDGDREVCEDFENDIYRWALESVSIVALNTRLGILDINADENSENNKLVSAVLELFEQLYQLDILPSYWKYFPSKKFDEFVKNLNFITDTTSKLIDEALADTKNENVPDHELGVLQRLAKVNKKTAFVMTQDMIGAGIDTTGKSLGAALYYLAKNPNKQSILREEVIKYLPEKDSVLTAEILSKMQYLKATVKETNRVAPIALGGLRTTSRNMVIGGYQIPKGTDIAPIHFYASALIDKNFKDPHKFLPERWLRSINDEYSAKHAHQFAYMPFGFGARSCIGKRLATLELEVAVANIIRNYELSWNQPDMRFGAKLIYGLIDPLTLTVKNVN